MNGEVIITPALGYYLRLTFCPAASGSQSQSRKLCWLEMRKLMGDEKDKCFTVMHLVSIHAVHLD